MKWIKTFCVKVLHKVEDHFATVVASAIIVTIMIFCAFFWEWLKTEHSPQMYGYMWLLISSISLGAIVYCLYATSRYFRKIKDPGDIRNVLSKYWRHIEKQRPDQLEFTLYFSWIDKKERLKRGSAKKYLREVITKDGKWAVVREGPDTLFIKRRQSQQVESIKSIMKKI